MTELAYKPFKGRTIRITQLAPCCTPPATGTSCALSVFDAFTTVSLAVNVEDGATAFERKANGDVCINERDPNLLQDLTVSLTLCQVKPEVISMFTGWPITTDAASGAAVGFDVMEGVTDNELAIEVWSGVSGTSCASGQRYGYNVIPCTSGWQIGENIEWAGIDTIFSVTLTATATGSHSWGTGPYAVHTGTGGRLFTPMQDGSLARLMSTTVAPPAITDGCVSATSANGYIGTLP